MHSPDFPLWWSLLSSSLLDVVICSRSCQMLCMAWFETSCSCLNARIRSSAWQVRPCGCMLFAENAETRDSCARSVTSVVRYVIALYLWFSTCCKFCCSSSFARRSDSTKEASAALRRTSSAFSLSSWWMDALARLYPSSAKKTSASFAHLGSKQQFMDFTLHILFFCSPASHCLLRLKQTNLLHIRLAFEQPSLFGAKIESYFVLRPTKRETGSRQNMFQRF